MVTEWATVIDICGQWKSEDWLFNTLLQAQWLIDEKGSDQMDSSRLVIQLSMTRKMDGKWKRRMK